MIYFDSGMVQIPRHSPETADELVLTNELTGERLTFDIVNLSDDDRYYLIGFGDSDSDFDLPVGTYRYELGEEVGLWQVGDYISVSPTYNERKTNIVYEG